MFYDFLRSSDYNDYPSLQTAENKAVKQSKPKLLQTVGNFNSKIYAGEKITHDNPEMTRVFFPASRM
jgi:hypothetical protein